MDRINKIAGLLFCLLLAGVVYAQKKGAKPKPGKASAPAAYTGKKLPRNFLPDVYLGRSAYRVGGIRKPVFDSLMKQGLSSHDSLGNNYKVTGFDFTYAERNLYEDSVANLMYVYDYQLEYCPGDTLSAGISAQLYTRTKPGDTVFFDKIRVVKLIPRAGSFDEDSVTIVGRPMKMAILK